MATVEVYGVSGEQLLDAVTFAESASVADVSDLVMSSWQGAKCRLKLLNGSEPMAHCKSLCDALGRHGQDHVHVLTAVMEPPLAEAERVKYLNMVQQHRSLASTFVKLPEDAQNDVEVACAFVASDGRCFEYVPSWMMQCREVVLAAVRTCKHALSLAHQSFKSDREVVLDAVQHFGVAVTFCDASLSSDKHFVLQVVKRNGNALEFLCQELKEDRDVVKAAVQQNGMAMEYAVGEMKRDKEVVMDAVNQYGGALRHAHESMHEDRQIVLAAVGQAGTTALKFVKSEWRHDPQVLQHANARHANVWRR
eukprot:TRINITY_DN58136_c0_g1_i1.p1 TRINITY_DN58136_c0_g1~~TRINITY_DN58136_c0_g1_i1.p1  ORF type:complete len:324 (+),score=36.22 TRINITY_DN58136_c0_g1_i1:51-974(+)